MTPDPSTPILPSPDRPRAGSARSWSLPARIVAVLGALLGAVGFVVAVGDPDGENPWSALMFAGPALAGAFPTLELAWDPRHDQSLERVARRWFLFPVIGAIGALMTLGAAELAARASGALPAARAADPYHYWFPVDGPAAPFLPFALLGYVAGLLLALTFFVLVLLPLQALLRPAQAVREAGLDDAPEHLGRNRIVVLLTPLLVLGAVAIGVGMALEIPLLATIATVLEVIMTLACVRLQRRAPRAGTG
ncbi:hypothetical protein [Brachybacterium hainanense]|uniref:Uncharacterized protein n=1 Tax=Brachybacterium hainanense TaxID=1541174 RepID=A0ABV6RDA6_9MICO